MATTQRAQARRAMLVAAAMSTLLAVSACAKSHAGMAAGSAVTASATASPAVIAAGSVAIRNFVFQPATLTIAAGSKVVWTNLDEEPHLVVSAGAQFPASPALDTGDSYSAVFAQPGTYTYFCSIHPHMVGTIVVK